MILKYKTKTGWRIDDNIPLSIEWHKFDVAEMSREYEKDSTDESSAKDQWEQLQQACKMVTMQRCYEAASDIQNIFSNESTKTDCAVIMYKAPKEAEFDTCVRFTNQSAYLLNNNGKTIETII